MKQFFLMSLMVLTGLGTPSPFWAQPTESRSISEKVHQGNELFEKRELEQALLHYQEALKGAAEEGQAKIHYNLANTLTLLGRFEESKKEFKEALLLDPEQKDAKYNLEASYFIQQGNEIELRPQAELEDASSPLDQQILQILQVLEQREFDFPKGVPHPPTPPHPSSKQQGKDW